MSSFSFQGHQTLVPHWGGAALLPYSLDFSTKPNGALPSGWTGATWAIASGVAVNTPTDGANLIANPELTVNTTGYTPNNNATLSRVDSTSDPGVVSPGADIWVLKVAYNGTANPEALFGITGLGVVTGQWYRFSVLGYAPSGNTAVNATKFIPSSNLGGGFTVTVTAENVWETLFNRIIRATNTTGTNALRCQTSSAGDVAYFDKIYLVPVSGLIATLDAGQSDVIVSGSWTVDAVHQAGVIALSDGTLNNCLVAIYNRAGGTAVLLQYVGGVVSQLISTVTAYVAGAKVEARISSNGAVAKLYYNNAQIGIDQTPNAAIQANTQCGLFSTGVSTCSLFTVTAN